MPPKPDPTPKCEDGAVQLVMGSGGLRSLSGVPALQHNPFLVGYKSCHVWKCLTVPDFTTYLTCQDEPLRVNMSLFSLSPYSEGRPGSEVSRGEVEAVEGLVGAVDGAPSGAHSADQSAKAWWRNSYCSGVWIMPPL